MSGITGKEVSGNIRDVEKKIDKNRRYCTIDESLAEMLITQLGAELSNKHLEEYFKMRAAEEELHHIWIYDYLGYNDVEFLYPAVAEINVDIKNRVDPFLLTVDKEIETTMSIYKIYEKAQELKDYATMAWLNGCGPIDGKLVPEQVEEESISRTIADMAQEDAPWLIKQNSILSFYKGYPNCD